jgi:hypothetical protein
VVGADVAGGLDDPVRYVPTPEHGERGAELSRNLAKALGLRQVFGAGLNGDDGA